MMTNWYHTVTCACFLCIVLTPSGLRAQDAPVTINGGGVIQALAFSPDGKTLAAAGISDIKLWDIETRKVKSAIKQRYTSSVAFSPDGKSLASEGVDIPIALWDSDTGEKRVAFPPESSLYNSLAFSPDGKTLATGGGVKLADNVLTLYDVATGKSKTTFTNAGPGKKVWRVVFSPDGKTLVAASNGVGNVKLWDVETGKHRSTLKEHFAQGHVAFSPDGKTLASAGFNTLPKQPRSFILLWDIETGKERATLQGQRPDIIGLAFSPDSKTLASAYDRTVRLWDIETGKDRILKGHTGTIMALAFSPDGKSVASGGVDTTIKIWNVKDRFSKP